MIISKTPFRVSLFGGGTDYYEWFSKYEGAIIGTSIDKYCYVSLKELGKFSEYRYRLVYHLIEQGNDFQKIKHTPIKKIIQKYIPNKNLEINYFSDLPARTGIGSSSSFVVGMLSSILYDKKIKFNRNFLAKKAIEVERKLLKENVGFQDQILTTFGGLNFIKFGKNDFKVSKIKLKETKKKELENSLYLVNTGIKRIASHEAKKLIQSFNKKKLILDEIYNITFEAKKILENDKLNIDEIGRMLDYSWSLKRQITDSISSTKIDELYQYGMTKGALGGKLLGAGNGGFILFYVKPENSKKFLRSFKSNQVVKIGFDNLGNQVKKF